MRKEEVGSRLKQFRKQAGLSQQALAEALHVTRLTITRYEAGQLSMGAESLERLASVCGVNLSWLLTGAEALTPYTPSESKEITEIIQALKKDNNLVDVVIKIVKGWKKI